jgi:hypothetical protein
MNGDESQLENQLRNATEFKPAADAERDAETAALAEGWLALGRLLTAANADFRPERVVKQLRRRLLRQRLWRGGALLAATLLLGLGITWYANRGAGLIDQRGLPHDGSAEIVKQPAVKPAGSAGWDQGIDQQISQADESARPSEMLDSREDHSIDELDRQLTSFRQEVEATSL